MVLGCHDVQNRHNQDFETRTSDRTKGGKCITPSSHMPIIIFLILFEGDSLIATDYKCLISVKEIWVRSLFSLVKNCFLTKGILKEILSTSSFLFPPCNVYILCPACYVWFNSHNVLPNIQEKIKEQKLHGNTTVRRIMDLWKPIHGWSSLNQSQNHCSKFFSLSFPKYSFLNISHFKVYTHINVNKKSNMKSCVFGKCHYSSILEIHDTYEYDKGSSIVCFNAELVDHHRQSIWEQFHHSRRKPLIYFLFV